MAPSRRKSPRSSGSPDFPLVRDQPLYNDATLVLTGQISNASVFEVLTSIISYAQEPEDKWPAHITLFINSVGGDLHAAFSLSDVIKMSPIPVATYGLGCCMSAGVMLLMSGVKGGRFITENTMLMSHQFAGVKGGKDHEMQASLKEMDFYRDRILNHYQKCTGKTRASIVKKLLPASDVYITPKEAVELGIVDTVVKVY